MKATVLCRNLHFCIISPKMTWQLLSKSFYCNLRCWDSFQNPSHLAKSHYLWKLSCDGDLFGSAPSQYFIIFHFSSSVWGLCLWYFPGFAALEDMGNKLPNVWNVRIGPSFEVYVNLLTAAIFGRLMQYLQWRYLCEVHNKIPYINLNFKTRKCRQSCWYFLFHNHEVN